MAKKKTLKKKVQAKPSVGKFATDSARDIWLAGLGAFSIAQQESGKILEQGTKLFDKLVKEGSKLEDKTRQAAESTVGGLREGVEDRVGAMRQQASDNWDKLEKVFEERVARVLGRLGVPTAEDVKDLTGRVTRLAEQVSKAAKEAFEPASPAEKVVKKATRTAKKATSKAKSTAKKVAKKVEAA